MAFNMKRVQARLILLVMVAFIIAIFLVIPTINHFVGNIASGIDTTELFQANSGVPYKLLYGSIFRITVEQISTNSSTNSTTLYL